MSDGLSGCITAAKHCIELPYNQTSPVHSAPYQAGPRTRELKKADIDKNLKEKAVELAQKECATLIVFAPKKDGISQFWDDSHELNDGTECALYLKPRIDECLNSFGEDAFFSTLDAKSGYRQIQFEKPDQPDRDKTVYTSHNGLYRFIHMPFGLRIAPGTFQRNMDVTLATVKCQFAFVYLEDVVMLSIFWEVGSRHIREGLTLLNRASVILKLKKCQIFTVTIDYLGHVIRPRCFEIAFNPTGAIGRP